MAFYYTGTHYTRATLWQPYTILLTHQNTNVGGHGSSPQNIDNHVKSVLFSSNNNVHKILSWQNVYNIVYSQAVTHPSTNTTQCCLTSVIGRELVLSTWYGRRQFMYVRIAGPTKKNWNLLSSPILTDMVLFKVAWPSGLRRWFKAPVSSGAWVRIPPLPKKFCQKLKGDTRIWTMDLSDCSRLLYHWAISPGLQKPVFRSAQHIHWQVTGHPGGHFA